MMNKYVVLLRYILHRTRLVTCLQYSAANTSGSDVLWWQAFCMVGIYATVNK